MANEDRKLTSVHHLVLKPEDAFSGVSITSLKPGAVFIRYHQVYMLGDIDRLYTVTTHEIPIINLETGKVILISSDEIVYPVTDVVMKFKSHRIPK